jgi:hypothetical protein
MTTRTIEVTCKDFIALEPPRHFWRVRVWLPSTPTPEDRRISADASRVEYDTEQDAVAAAKELAARTSLPLEPEIGHHEAKPYEYRDRGFDAPEEEFDWEKIKKNTREVHESASKSKEPCYLAGWRWYFVKRPSLEWRLFRKKGLGYYCRRTINNWIGGIKDFFNWRWHYYHWHQGPTLKELHRIRLVHGIEDSMRTDEEGKAYRREFMIKLIEEYGPSHMVSWEDLPDGTSLRVTYTLSYDPVADEFLESEHKYEDDRSGCRPPAERRG